MQLQVLKPFKLAEEHQFTASDDAVLKKLFEISSFFIYEEGEEEKAKEEAKALLNQDTPGAYIILYPVKKGESSVANICEKTFTVMHLAEENGSENTIKDNIKIRLERQHSSSDIQYERDSLNSGLIINIKDDETKVEEHVSRVFYKQYYPHAKKIAEELVEKVLKDLPPEILASGPLDLKNNNHSDVLEANIKSLVKPIPEAVLNRLTNWKTTGVMNEETFKKDYPLNETLVKIRDNIFHTVPGFKDYFESVNDGYLFPLMNGEALLNLISDLKKFFIYNECIKKIPEYKYRNGLSQKDRINQTDELNNYFLMRNMHALDKPLINYIKKQPYFKIKINSLLKAQKYETSLVKKSEKKHAFFIREFTKEEIDKSLQIREREKNIRQYKFIDHSKVEEQVKNHHLFVITAYIGSDSIGFYKDWHLLIQRNGGVLLSHSNNGSIEEKNYISFDEAVKDVTDYINSEKERILNEAREKAKQEEAEAKEKEKQAFEEAKKKEEQLLKEAREKEKQAQEEAKRQEKMVLMIQESKKIKPEEKKSLQPITTDAAWIFDHIYQHRYARLDVLKIFTDPVETIIPQTIARQHHGIQHVSRVALYIPILVTLYKRHGNKEVSRLTEQDIQLIQIAALFHDAGREADGADQPDWERNGGSALYYYLTINLGIDPTKAILLAESTVNKDWEIGKPYYKITIIKDGFIEWKQAGISDTPKEKSIYENLIHDADSLDIRRVRNIYDATYLDFFKDMIQNCEIEIIDTMSHIEKLPNRLYIQFTGSGVLYQTREMLKPAIITKDEFKSAGFSDISEYSSKLLSDQEKRIFKINVLKEINKKRILTFGHDSAFKEMTGLIDEVDGLLTQQGDNLHTKNRNIKHQYEHRDAYRVVSETIQDATKYPILYHFSNGYLGKLYHVSDLPDDKVILARGIDNPTLYLPPRSDGFIEYSAAREIRKVKRQPGIPSRRGSTNKNGNPFRSLSIIANGSKVFYPVGYLTVNPKIDDVHSVSLTSTGVGKKKEWRDKPSASPEINRDSLYFYHQKERMGGSITRDSSRYFIEALMNVKDYDAVFFTHNKGTNEKHQPTSYNTHCIEAIFLQMEYMKEKKKEIKIYEYQSPPTLWIERKYTPQDIKKLWGELFNKHKELVVNTINHIFNIPNEIFDVDLFKIKSMYKPISDHQKFVPADVHYEDTLKKEINSEINTIVKEIKLEYARKFEKELSEIKSILCIQNSSVPQTGISNLMAYLSIGFTHFLDAGEQKISKEDYHKTKDIFNALQLLSKNLSYINTCCVTIELKQQYIQVIEKIHTRFSALTPQQLSSKSKLILTELNDSLTFVEKEFININNKVQALEKEELQKVAKEKAERRKEDEAKKLEEVRKKEAADKLEREARVAKKVEEAKKIEKDSRTKEISKIIEKNPKLTHLNAYVNKFSDSFISECLKNHNLLHNVSTLFNDKIPTTTSLSDKKEMEHFVARDAFFLLFDEKHSNHLSKMIDCYVSLVNYSRPPSALVVSSFLQSERTLDIAKELTITILRALNNDDSNAQDNILKKIDEDVDTLLKQLLIKKPYEQDKALYDIFNAGFPEIYKKMMTSDPAPNPPLSLGATATK